MSPIRAYLAIDIVRMLRPGFADLQRGGYRYVARWIGRGTGTVLYSSSPKFTRAEVETLARKWIAKHASDVVEAAL